jgi:hypothetical protein
MLSASDLRDTYGSKAERWVEDNILPYIIKAAKNKEHHLFTAHITKEAIAILKRYGYTVERFPNGWDIQWS